MVHGVAMKFAEWFYCTT